MHWTKLDLLYLARALLCVAGGVVYVRGRI